MRGKKVKQLRDILIARVGLQAWRQYTRDGHSGGTCNIGLGGAFRRMKRLYSRGRFI